MPRRLLAPAAALLLLALAFLPALGNGFVDYDDPVYVTENPAVLRGLGAAGLAWALTDTHAANWHPLTWLSHMLDVTLFGVRPAGHHLTSLVLHAAAAVALLAALAALTGAVWRSAAVAALFLVHPLRVESVAWVSERKDVLSGLLFMLVLLAYERHARRPSGARAAAVAALFALGLAAKPMLVTLPFVLLLLDWWPLGRLRGAGLRGLAAAAREKAPLFALAALASAVTLYAQRAGGATRLNEAFPLGVRIANAFAAAAGYLGKALWPAHLASFYPHLGRDLPPWQAALSALLLAGVTAAALRWWRRSPWLPAGWLWYLGMLVPVSGVVQVGLQSMADRYTYLPLVGVAIAAVWSVDALTRRFPRRAVLLAPAAALLLGALALATWRQTGVWKDADTLLANDLEVNSGGAALRPPPADPRALAELQAAAAARPDDAAARNALGAALARAGRVDEAVAQFRRALQLAPGSAEAHYNLGLAYDVLGLRESADREYRQTLRLAPGHAPACNNLGVNLALDGRHAEAVAWFERALRLRPDFAEARFNLVQSQALLGTRGRP
jgi:tetratricopeptide (TPR) repeat protein